MLKSLDIPNQKTYNDAEYEISFTLKGNGMDKKLSDFKNDESGIVRSVTGEGRLRRRLFDMGVTPGAEIKLKKRAPLGDPIEVNLRGYELTLRKTEADLVIMEKNK